MVAKALLRAFLEYNYQINAEILQAIAALTPEQVGRSSDMSHGNAPDLIRHMADSEWSWRLYAAGGAGGTGGKYLWEVEDISDFEKLAAFWQAERAQMLAYLDSLSEADLVEMVELSPSLTVPRWQIFLHLINHSTHHRSELGQYLTQCGHPISEEETNFIQFDVQA